MAAPMKTCLSFNNKLLIPCICVVRHFVSQKNVRVRFAPSPTGMLHLGGLRTALYNYMFAKSHLNGKFVLRIEDTDQARLVPGAADKLEETLTWAGITPDEGPSQGGSFGPYLQSQRVELYQEEIKALIENGSAYHCFCTPKRLELLRKDSLRRGETPKYDNKCRHVTQLEVKERLARNTPFVVRFKLDAVATWDDLVKGPCTHNVMDIEGDPVLIKSDNFPTYHFANVVDDHYMKITHVLRGEEWQSSTPKHLLLFKAFGWDPPLYAHLPLILNSDGTKLSKRQDDIRVEVLQREGFLPEAVLNYITKTGGGFSSDGTTGWLLDDMVRKFSIHNVQSHSARLDPHFLHEANRIHLTRRLQDETLRKDTIDELRSSVLSLYQDRLGDGCLRENILSTEYIDSILDWAVQETRITKVKDLVEDRFQFLWTTPQSEHIQNLNNAPFNVTRTLEHCIEKLSSLHRFTMSEISKSIKLVIQEEGTKTSVAMKCLRQALSGLQEGPPVAEMMTILGKENTLHRLHHSVNTLKKLS